jgi:filamentous hemagglutinin
LYTYAHLNSLRYTDPDGRASAAEVVAVAAILYLTSAVLPGHEQRVESLSKAWKALTKDNGSTTISASPTMPPPDDPDGDKSGSSSTKGLSEDARFAQRNYSEKFSEKGAKELTKIVGRPVNTIDDLANAIRGGEVNPSQVPVNTINRGGNTLVLNTRSVQALQRAGVPRSEFNVINRTGQPRFERMLDNQLRRSNLSNEGIRNVVPRD